MYENYLMFSRCAFGVSFEHESIWLLPIWTRYLAFEKYIIKRDPYTINNPRVRSKIRRGGTAATVVGCIISVQGERNNARYLL